MRPSMSVIARVGASSPAAGRSPPPPAIAWNEEKSSPAQKPRPSPESTTARTERSDFSPSPASTMAANIAGSNALILSGRVRRTSATPSEETVTDTRSAMRRNVALRSGVMDFEIPADITALLERIDDFIEREIKPLENEDDNIRFFDHRREYARTDFENGGIPPKGGERLSGG